MTRPAEPGPAALAARLARVMITGGDQETGGPAPEVLVARARRGGATLILLREKHLDARALAPLAQALVGRSGLPVVISGEVALARAVGAAGVHLAAAGPPVSEARGALAPGALVGVSVHSLEEARARAAEGADYLLFGPVEATPKPWGLVPGRGLPALAAVCGAVTTPVVAVGGLGPGDAAAVAEAGAVGWAAIRAFGPEPAA